MDWQVLQDGLKTFVAAASGMDPNNIGWDGEPEQMRGYPMAMLELQNDGRDAGTDELRHEPNDEGQLIPVVVGNRSVTLVITVKSRDQRAAYKAPVILGRLRTRLELPEMQDQLDELEVALREVAPRSVDRSAVSQQREESIAQLSITLGYRVEERDEEHLGDPIEHVELSGDVTTSAAEGGEIINVPEQTIP